MLPQHPQNIPTWQLQISTMRAHICQVLYVILLLKLILADLPADLPPLLWPMDPLVNQEYMPWKLLHHTLQMNLLWLMDPHPPSESRIDALNTATPNLADKPMLANGPQWIKNRCLEYHYTKLGRWTYFGQWTPWYWHLVVQNGNLTLLLTSSGQEWQFHIAIDM